MNKGSLTLSAPEIKDMGRLAHLGAAIGGHGA
jgi:hypothetical protein